MVEAGDIVTETTASLKPIDDLAVVVLFSVFESQVRDYLVERIRPEVDGLTDPILKEAAAGAIQGVEEGSFYRRVLEPLKLQGRVSPDLVTQVDQVRVYRNWVAHGRRERALDVSNVSPPLPTSGSGNSWRCLALRPKARKRNQNRPRKNTNEGRERGLVQSLRMEHWLAPLSQGRMSSLRPPGSSASGAVILKRR
jgi:hypothetical protein